MAGNDAKKNDVFDLEQLRDLIELMNQYDLHEVDLKQDKQQIRLSRGAEVITTTAAPVAPAAPVPAAAAAAPSATTEDPANVVTITSPMVGTFYLKPNPDSEPFVKVGDVISADTVVCIIEAMKVFNEIPAEVSGKVIAVLAGNEESVEFGKPLFKVET
ncbi:MAG: acetyl-CoA carboxylase biotin carboxyl carrier protein [Planctomycetota bacterium]